MDARPGPDWARPTGGKIKGFAVVNLLALAKERYGPQTLFDYAQTVPAEFRTQVEKQMVLASAWVPMELYYSAIGFLVRRHHQGDPMAARQLGHDLTSKDVNSFFRMFLDFTSPSMVIGLSNRLWGMYLDRGRIAVVQNDPGCVKAEVSDWPLCDEFTANELAGGTMAFLEHSRAKDCAIASLEAPSATTLLLSVTYKH